MTSISRYLVKNLRPSKSPVSSTSAATNFFLLLSSQTAARLPPPSSLPLSPSPSSSLSSSIAFFLEAFFFLRSFFRRRWRLLVPLLLSLSLLLSERFDEAGREAAAGTPGLFGAKASKACAIIPNIICIPRSLLLSWRRCCRSSRSILSASFLSRLSCASRCADSDARNA